MNDEKLLRVMEFMDAECLYQDQRVVTERNPKATLKKIQRKTDICLRSLDNEMLNDLVIMVKVGKYDGYRMNDPTWEKAKRSLSIDDLTGWCKLIGASRLSSDDCIRYLRSWSPETLLNDIKSYLTMEPVPTRHSILLRKINENMVTNRQKHARIETR